MIRKRNQAETLGTVTEDKRRLHVLTASVSPWFLQTYPIREQSQNGGFIIPAQVALAKYLIFPHVAILYSSEKSQTVQWALLGQGL